MMSKIDQSILITTDELNNIDLSQLLSPLPADFMDLLTPSCSSTTESQSESSLTLEACPQMNSNPLDHSVETQPGYSPENQSNHHEMTNHLSQAVALPENLEMNFERLKIIAQPFFGNKLRYRSDYEKNENRLGVLKNRNKNSSYQGPAIQIPQIYLDTNGGYFIRVTLVTIPYGKTNLHYLHPYELEHPLDKQYNEPSINTVWFPIQSEDCLMGIKSFPTLRIVKKRATDLKSYGDLRAFDCQYQNSSTNAIPQCADTKATISEFNLERSQLVFTVGREFSQNGQTHLQMFPNSTVYSEEMLEGVGKDLDTEQETQPTNEKAIAQPTSCRVYKYAPRYGFDTNEEEMMVFLTSKLEPRKYGELRITFECETFEGPWKQSIANIDIKDRMVSFKTPVFTHSIEMIKEVNVILEQEQRTIEKIKYFYLSTKNQCFNCQSNAIENPFTSFLRNIPHKRPVSFLNMPDFESDVFVPVDSSPPPSTDTSNDPLAKLTEGFKELFLENNYTTIFRMCRSTLKQSPDLLHCAIDNNHSELLIKFIPTSVNSILQLRNSLDETALLHSIRLNRTEIVRAILAKPNSEVLLEDLDRKENNIFHFTALHSTTLEIVELLLQYLREKQIPIEKKFDYVNAEQWTPLQLSICEKNLPIMKVFLQYFDRKIYQTKTETGDNLVHLAVRYGDLEMVKYLIEEGKLREQGNESNLQATPKELAKMLQRDDMVEYFNRMYPEALVGNSDSSDDDEDE